MEKALNFKTFLAMLVALGLVACDSSEDTGDATPNQNQQSDQTQTPGPAPEPEQNSEPEDDPAQDPAASPQPSPEPEPEPVPAPEPTPAPEPEPDPESRLTPKPAPAPEPETAPVGGNAYTEEYGEPRVIPQAFREYPEWGVFVYNDQLLQMYKERLDKAQGDLETITRLQDQMTKAAAEKEAAYGAMSQRHKNE